MKFTCDAADLVAAIGVSAKACGRAGSIQQLRYLTIRARKTERRIEFFCTDMEIAIDATMPCKTVATTGTAVVADGPKLLQALKLLTGELTVTADKTQLTVTSGKSKLTFELGVAADAPTIKATEPDTTHLIDGATFSGLHRAVSPAISVDYSRPVLTGLLLQTVKGKGKQPGTLRLVGTDSYRLALAEEPMADYQAVTDYTALIPNRAALIVAKLQAGAVRVGTGGGWVMLRLENAKAPGDVTVWGRQIDGQYPKYEQLFPDAFEHEAPLRRAELVSALKPLVKVAGLTPVRLIPDGDTLTLNVNGMTTSLPFAEGFEFVDDRPFEIGFNARFLLDSVEAHTGELVTLKLIQPLRPAIVAGDEGKQVLIMPIRLSEATITKPTTKPKEAKKMTKTTTQKAPVAAKPVRMTKKAAAEAAAAIAEARSAAARKAHETRKRNAAAQATGKPAAKKTAAAKPERKPVASKPAKKPAAKPTARATRGRSMAAVATGDFGKLIELARKIVDQRDDGMTYASTLDTYRLAELVQALDEWLAKGGFAPKRWITEREKARQAIREALKGDAGGLLGVDVLTDRVLIALFGSAT